jgi:hypothetical protein
LCPYWVEWNKTCISHVMEDSTFHFHNLLYIQSINKQKILLQNNI